MISASDLASLPLWIFSKHHSYWVACTCRYVLVYHYGGVYADLDTECYEHIERWAPQPECKVALFLELTGPQFGQYAFGATPGHPLLGALVEAVEVKIRTGDFKVGDERHDGVLNFAGPLLFNKVVQPYLAELVGSEVPSRSTMNMWQEEHASELRASGICTLNFEQLGAFLYNHKSSHEKLYQSASHGGSWRKQDEIIRAGR